MFLGMNSAMVMGIMLIATVIMLFAVILQLYYVIAIERKSEDMKNQVWAYIADVGLFTTADWIVKNHKNGQDVKALYEYWKAEYELNDKNDEDWDEKYRKAFKYVDDLICKTIEKWM